MKYKIYLTLFILFTVPLVGAAIYIGYYYQVPEVFYTRQDRINRLSIDKEFWCKESDGLILGSSRTKNLGDINAHGIKLYNITANGLYPDSYSEYIDFFKAKCNKKPDYILIGLDFFTSNINQPNQAEPPAFFINNSKKPLSYLLTYKHFDDRFKALQLGIGTWGYPQGFRNLRDNLDANLHINKEKVLPVMPTIYKHNRWYNALYGNFNYDTKIASHFNKVVNENSDSIIRVWITPISRRMFSLMIQFGLQEEYKQFVRDAVTAFGEIDNFMFINEITAAQENFEDDAHIRFDMLDFMAAKALDSCSNCNAFSNFSKRLNKSNVEDFLIEFDEYIDRHQVVGDVVAIRAPHFQTINRSIKPGLHLDLVIDEQHGKNIGSVDLCIQGKGDFSVILFDRLERVSSRIYQSRSDCHFNVPNIKGISKIRLLPLYNYPLTLSAIDIITSDAHSTARH